MNVPFLYKYNKIIYRLPLNLTHIQKLVMIITSSDITRYQWNVSFLGREKTEN